MLYQGSLSTECSIRQSIRDFYRKDEDEVLNHLLPIADMSAKDRSQIWELARRMVVEIRKVQIGKGGVDALLSEYSLSSEEGVVLMCLAEALLRVPDKDTIDRLIRDKLSQGDWSSHLGNSESIFVNASAWGLLMTGKMVNYNDKNHKKQFNVLKRTMGRLGEPVIRKAVKYAMQIMGAQFVMGVNIGAAIGRAKAMEAKGYRYSYDMLGEGARTMKDADRYFDTYMMAIDRIGKAAANRGPVESPGISVKLSAIHPRYEFSHQDRVKEELIPRLKELALRAKQYNIGFTVDAEEADRLDISLDIIEAVFADNDLANWDGFGIAVQAYQKRAIHVIEWVRDLTQRVGRKMMVRLVKGAYWDSEIKWSQVDGFRDYPVFTRKPSTDVSYQACAKKLLEYRDTIYPQFATHNAYTVATILTMCGDKSGFEFQRLHGMGEALYDQVVCEHQLPCRVYAPVGEHADLLAYLVRRLLENGANSSFVNNIVDESISVESLLEDPIEKVGKWKQKRNSHIPMPMGIYGPDRQNSKGIDLTEPQAVEQLKNLMEQWFQSATKNLEGENPVVNPANHGEVVGQRPQDSEEVMEEKIARAHAAYPSWASQSPQVRAELLNKIADLLEDDISTLIGLCVKEAGKSVPDSVAEVREAVDFCRYYANQSLVLMASNEHKARGVFLCISPWNFPLAIFLGQVTAAISVGNTVVAKPAEQTSLIALRALELMKQAGLPEGVVELLISPGRPVGEKAVPDSRIQGVMFTGSTETGNWISRKLADRECGSVPLIAETGGQNAMIVDSTALPEQVVDDVISSGFQSAGQRCSALRVLFLQEDVADKIIDMIKGAMKELHVSDPAMLDSDVGPVIDDKALNRLNAHVEYLQDKGKLVHKCELSVTHDNSHNFFVPHLYEIPSLSVLENEVFGPVVHVIRFSADELDSVINQINDTGFGLTMGVHSRIEEVTRYVAAKVKVGNVYVNRNMIGAVVGVQPFGGRGLSGTGPKAGGPHYLTRLVEPAQVTEKVTMSDETRTLVVEMEQQIAEANRVTLDLAQGCSESQTHWDHLSVNDRVSVLKQSVAHMVANSHFEELDEVLLDKVSQVILSAEKAMSKPTILPGPTGESNILYLESRGTLVSVLDSMDNAAYWLLSSFSAMVAGNNLIVVASEECKPFANALNTALNQSVSNEKLMQVTDLVNLKALMSSESIEGCIVSQSSELHSFVAEQLAWRNGAILPVICERVDDGLVHRMVTEKTVTIDTTAAGGNASLMTMVEEQA